MSDDPPKLDEFALIEKFFCFSDPKESFWPTQGIRDDCAFLDIGNTRIALTTDMEALGTHFLDDADPYFVGRKCLAVNLSDLAAAGATPRAYLMSIGLPGCDRQWLSEFTRGLEDLSKEYNCPLIGGDTTKTPVVNGAQGKTTVCITAIGELKPKTGLTRDGAKVGDDIWVSGTPGDAYAALGSIWKEFEVPTKYFEYFKARMDNPTPRIELGENLIGVADACCDISDGLIGDLRHILKQSDCSACLLWYKFPKSEGMQRLSQEIQQKCILAGGDDYELLFTANPDKRRQIEELSKRLDLPLTRIGTITDKKDPLTIVGEDGKKLPVPVGFNHFE